ncbi:hypothetical protein EX30DRAFT_349466 [Ascodesmis nigricans]|uniref:Uncharacterized protein n=1 Tax=Ascodesmis nigricans TaxID=341454 RepID=A0A4S2MUV2_9PEZI|nr:hypothetical protein EX30DRAFT_349466 [Ascodesmis nigricans]
MAEPTLANNLAPLEAATDDSAGHDSGIEDVSLASSTQSLTESIREQVYENGRRYHRKSQEKYAMPSDEALEFGDEHPGSTVIGVDLAPIQPWTEHTATGSP